MSRNAISMRQNEDRERKVGKFGGESSEMLSVRRRHSTNEFASEYFACIAFVSVRTGENWFLLFSLINAPEHLTSPDTRWVRFILIECATHTHTM